MGTGLVVRGVLGGSMLAITALPAFAQALATHRVPAALEGAQGYATTAVLVDASGARQALLRGDNAGIHTLDSAFGKAYTSASFKGPSAAVAERLLAHPPTAQLGLLPHVLLLGGGLPIKIGDEVVGGIGVSGAPGGEKDEACAKAALDKIGDRLK